VSDLDAVKEFLVTRGQAYRQTFKSTYGERVLTDLAWFCRADASTFDPDPRIEGVLQGRREVWLRIAKHLNLSPDELQRHFNPQGE